VRLPREGLFFLFDGDVVEFMGALSAKAAWVNVSWGWPWVAFKSDLKPLTPAARELLKLDWIAL
jgi:hypothetical protein